VSGHKVTQSDTYEVVTSNLIRPHKGTFTTSGASIDDCANLPPESIYQFIKGDFTSLWDSLALNKNPSNEGNFTFALLGMILLEFIATYCKIDKSGGKIKDFSEKLRSIDPRYFREFPAFKPSKRIRKLGLPTISGESNEFVHILFDLIRNGQAHHYQQTIVDLQDARFEVSISGRIGVQGRFEGLLLKEMEELLKGPQGATMRESHLNPSRGLNCIFISFLPGVFFIDITTAFEDSGILEEGLDFNSLLPRKQNYSILTSDEFASIHTESNRHRKNRRKEVEGP
jgi:hypothetical protein